MLAKKDLMKRFTNTLWKNRNWQRYAKIGQNRECHGLESMKGAYSFIRPFCSHVVHWHFPVFLSRISRFSNQQCLVHKRRHMVSISTEEEKEGRKKQCQIFQILLSYVQNIFGCLEEEKSIFKDLPKEKQPGEIWCSVYFELRNDRISSLQRFRIETLEWFSKIVTK